MAALNAQSDHSVNMFRVRVTLRDVLLLTAGMGAFLGLVLSVIRAQPGLQVTSNVVVSTKGKVCAAAVQYADASHELLVWNPITRSRQHRLPVPGYVSRVVLSPMGESVAAAAEDGVHIWELESGVERAVIPVPHERILSLAVCEGWLVVASPTTPPVLWDRSGRTARGRLGGDGSISAMAFSHDERLLATASYENVKLWNVRTRTVIHVLEQGRQRKWSLRFSPDDRLIASWDERGRVQVWDVQTGRQVAVMEHGRPGVADLTFSGDSARLAVVGEGTLRVWDIATMQQLLDLPQDVSQAAFCDMDKRVVTVRGDRDLTAEIYDLSGQRLAVASLIDRRTVPWSLYAPVLITWMSVWIVTRRNDGRRPCGSIRAKMVTLVILLTSVAALDYCICRPVRCREAAIGRVHALGGSILKQQIVTPYWLRKVFGDRMFTRVQAVSLSPDTYPSGASLSRHASAPSGVTQSQAIDLGFLKDLPEIKWLILSDTDVRDDQLAQLRCLSDLCMLGLDHTNVSDRGVAHLIGMQSLLQIDLSYSQLTDAGLRHVGALKNLMIVNIGHTKVTDDGLVHLWALTSLQYVVLDGSEVTDAGRQELSRRIPRLQYGMPL
jgi:WD40 repeat protein